MYAIVGGTAVAQWLRCCAANRKVTGSIPDGVIGIFYWHNPSDRTYGPGVDSASNRNEYQENFLKVNSACSQISWQRYFPVPLSWNLGNLTSRNPLGHSRPVTGLLYFYSSLELSTTSQSFRLRRIFHYNQGMERNCANILAAIKTLIYLALITPKFSEIIEFTERIIFSFDIRTVDKP